jgi:hypothetical protein
LSIFINMKKINLTLEQVVDLGIEVAFYFEYLKQLPKNENGLVVKSIPDMAKELNVGVYLVKTWNLKLVESGLILIKKTGLPAINHYTILKNN